MHAPDSVEDLGVISMTVFATEFLTNIGKKTNSACRQ